MIDIGFGSTPTNVTKLEVAAGVANGIGNGSVLLLCAPYSP